MNRQDVQEPRHERKSRRFSEERRRYILDRLDHDGSVLVSDLADELVVSAVTIRNDLKTLSDDGLVFRTHGGAVKADFTLVDRTLSEKQKIFSEAKAAIARKAVTYIRDGQSIILDSGSTTTEIARALKSQRLEQVTVITNALNIASELLDAPGIRIIMTGGLLRRESTSVVGPLAEESLKRLTADIFFMGVDAVDPQFGFMTPNLAEAGINQQMINISREVIVVTDPSKFGRRSLAVICPTNIVKRIITTKGIEEKFREETEATGVELVLVDA
jgi:DeoR family transcriptional regulator of aga operon